MKKIKKYRGLLFIDKVDGRKIVENDGYFEISTTSLKKALEELLDMCIKICGKNILIGISIITCDDRLIDWNYKNSVCYKDEKLRNYYWC